MIAQFHFSMIMISNLPTGDDFQSARRRIQRDGFMLGTDGILSRLAIAALENARDDVWREQHQFTHVVSLLEASIHHALPKLDKTKHLIVDVEDTYKNVIEFHHIVKWMTKVLAANANHKILVHCFMGNSRSPTAMAAFLLHYDGTRFGYNARFVLEFLKTKRRTICPRPVFVRQLVAYARSLASKRPRLQQNDSRARKLHRLKPRKTLFMRVHKN